MDDKTKAIIAHITLVGWLITLIINLTDKQTTLASFYLRQLLGIHLASMLATTIPKIGWILVILIFVFWLISLIGAIKGEKTEVPWVGEYFQKWFDFL